MAMMSEHGGFPDRISPRSRCAAAFFAIRKALRAVDDSWAGDLIGAVSLFATLYVVICAAWVLE